jgi:hypothetical protein
VEELPPVERATLEHALARGLLTPSQVQEALAEGGDVLGRLGVHLSDSARQELGTVFRRESGRLQRPDMDDETVAGSIDPRSPSDMARINAALPAPGELVGPYTIVRELARGGMGAVFVARHPDLDREVALKLRLSDDDDQEGRRFRLEAEALARIRHPNLVGIHELGEHCGRVYLVMDLVSGETLDQVVARQGPLAPRRAAQIVIPLAEAIHALHAEGILHRDLKPANVILEEGDHPQITDFGLAKDLTAAKGESLTQTGQILGTPSFMAPEQAAGERHRFGPCTDVYGLGAILYAILCGCPPFAGESLASAIKQVLTDDPVPPRKHNEHVEPELERICLRCLEKEPPDRYASAGDLAQDLHAYLGGRAVLAGASSGERRRGRLRLLLALAVTALVVGGGGWILKAYAERSREKAKEAQVAADQEQAWSEELEAALAADPGWAQAQVLEELLRRSEGAAPADRLKAQAQRQLLGDLERRALERFAALGTAPAAKQDDSTGAVLREHGRYVTPADLHATRQRLLQAWPRLLAKTALPQALKAKDVVVDFEGDAVLIGDQRGRLWRWPWRAQSKQLLATYAMAGHPLSLYALSVGQSRRWFTSEDRERTGPRRTAVLRNRLYLWQKGAPQPAQVEIETGWFAKALALDPQGSRAAVGGRGFAPRVYDGGGALVWGGTCEPRAATRALAWSPRGGLLVSTGERGEMCVFAGATGELLWAAPQAGFQGEGISIAPDARAVVVATTGKGLVIYVSDDESDAEPRAWRRLPLVTPDLSEITRGWSPGILRDKHIAWRDVEIDPTGRWLWATYGYTGGGQGESGDGGGIVLLEWPALLAAAKAAKRELVFATRLLHHFAYQLDQFRFSPDRRLLALGSWAGRVTVLEGDAVLAELDPPEGPTPR